MQILKTYEYIFSEDEIRQMIVDNFNRTNADHLPITKANVKIEFEHRTYCEPEAKAVITIEEG